MSFNSKLGEMASKDNDTEVLATIALSADNFPDFIAEYNKAVEAGKSAFHFQGEKMPVTIAKHIVEGLPPHVQEFLRGEREDLPDDTAGYIDLDDAHMPSDGTVH